MESSRAFVEGLIVVGSVVPFLTQHAHEPFSLAGSQARFRRSDALDRVHRLGGRRRTADLNAVLPAASVKRIRKVAISFAPLVQIVVPAPVGHFVCCQIARHLARLRDRQRCHADDQDKVEHDKQDRADDGKGANALLL
jgi:hypothetical protein